MRYLIIIITCSALAAVPALDISEPNILYTTAQRIASFNYPVSSHDVITPDGYVLTMFRIPFSPHNQNDTNPRPVVFLQHGLVTSSDSFINNGPDNALPYLLADAGYDVWMGNNRGNVYSRNNINISPDNSQFWQFTWHELGIIDMPAMIDYVLRETNQEQLHYIGHSQGTTVFFVLLSEIPEYNSKFKTSHMMAPVAFLNHVQGPIANIGASLLEDSPILSHLFYGHEFLPLTKSGSILGSEYCTDGSLFQGLCADILFALGGRDSKNLNYTLLPQVSETFPAGGSTGQVIHFGQLLKSGYFRKFDNGNEKNMRIYGQNTPPNYNESNIVTPVRFYYGDNDKFAPVVDVKRMENLLPNLVESYEVPVDGWTHIDFLWALNVKEVVYDKIIEAINYYEETGKQL